MPAYIYTALNESGRTIRGNLVADNEIDLEMRLREVGLDLITYRYAKMKAGGGSKVKLKDLMVLCLHLEQLCRAGVPIHEAVSDVRDSTESNVLRDIMTDVLEKLKGGLKLSEAVANYPRVFDETFVGLIAAGEENGDMTGAFIHMSDHLKWTNDLRRKIKKAMKYPIVLLVVMSIVIAILMIAVVPKLVTFIESQGFALPFHTRALIATSAAFQHYWFLIFGLPIGIIILVSILRRTSEPFAYRFDAFVLRVPAIGMTVRKINLARFVHFFSVMFRSGIDIPDSLLAARRVVSNRVLQDSVDLVYRSVTEGNNLTDSLRISNQFPTLVVRMFKVGEDSGNMNDALLNIKFFYDREVADSVDAMIGFIQPALTMVMGFLIFWVMAAVFGPIYQSFSNMKF